MDHLLESLEPRKLLAVNVSIPNGADTSLNGTATIVGGRLRLASDFNEAGSAWSNTPIPLASFRADFTYRVNAGASTADGFCFVVQNGPTTALGSEGLDLGYAGINNSEAACFNMYNLGAFGSQFGFASDGQTPPTTDDMSPMDFHAGGVFKGTVEYDGTTLKASIRPFFSQQLFQSTRTIDLAAAIGSSTAIVGFTGSTGVVRSTQYIGSASIVAHAVPPTVATPVASGPFASDGKSATLSVLGADAAGEGNLTYTWSVPKRPGGAPQPTFSANGTNAAKNTTMTFFKVGSYRVLCTITNPDGESVLSSLVVTVQNKLTSIRVEPHARTINRGSSLVYGATAHNQFGKRIDGGSGPVFAIAEGSGSIDPGTGSFIGTGGRGHVVISATISDTVDELAGTVGVTVI